MKEQDHLVIGVDLGGTHVYAGVVNTHGKVLLRAEADIDLSQDAETIIRKYIIPVIKEAIEENPDYTPRVRAVGMGVPGNHDSARGICFFSPNFHWHNVQVIAPIQEALNIPVFMLNDVRCATLGEKHFGAGRYFPNFVCCAIGTGIGGGVVCDGKLVLGDSEAAGEIGHITIIPDGHQCNCGNYGCMEALASGPNIARRAQEEAVKHPETLMLKLAEDISQISAHTAFLAAQKGDETALHVWRETGRFLGIGFANIAHTVNPSRIIIGGRVAGAMEFFVPAMKDEIRKRARMIRMDSLEIVPAKLKENAGLVGSAALAFEKTGIL